MKRFLTFAILAAIPITACDAAEPGQQANEQTEEGLGSETPGATPVAAAEQVRLETDSLPGTGTYLTDGEGRALYLFTADSAGASTCYDACAEAWPPLVAGEAEPAAGSGVRAGLIGTLDRQSAERQGAGRQVTYAGHPLYYYAQDQGSGDTAGQDVHGFGGGWYLVTPAGEALHGDDHGESHGEEEGSRS